MNVHAIAISQILTGLVVVAVFLFAVRRNRIRTETRLRLVAEAVQAEVTAARAEVAQARLEVPAELIVMLDLSKEDVPPDLSAAAQRAQPLVLALSQHEQSLGGAGLTLTAAKMEPGALRLTLSPINRLGSGSRVRRVAEEVNNASSPLPPGVTAAHANVLAL